MKIPTYRQKTARPRQGSGQMINVRLNESAMAAPALAYADSGKQLAQAGQQISDFFYKKVLATAETEAATANSEYQIELQNLEEELLRQKDMAKAEKEFARRAKNAQTRYNTKLSNSLGRKSFGSLAASSLTKQSLSFSRKANLKIVDQTKAASDNAVFTSVRNAADLNRGNLTRISDIVEIRTHLEKVAPIIGAEEAATKLRTSFTEITSGILTNKMNAAVAADKNPHDVIEDWMAGRDTDPVLKELDTAVSDKDKAAIEKKLLSIADSIDTRKAREEKRTADRDKKIAKESVAKVINVDRNNPAEFAEARQAHNDNIKYNRYTSRSQRLAAEMALGVTDDPAMTLRPDGQGNSNVYARLKGMASNDSLSLRELNLFADKLDAGQYKELAGEANRDKSAALQSAEDTMRKTFNFYKTNIIKDPSLQRLASNAFSAVSLGLEKFIRQNRNAGPKEIEAETQRLIKELEPAFKQRKLDLAFESIAASYANLGLARGTSALGIDVPTQTNLPEILQQIRTQIAANPGPAQKLFREQLYQLQGHILMATQ